MQICWTQLFLIHILKKNIQNGFYPAASSCRQYKDSRWGFCYWTFFSSAFSSLKETHSKASFWRASCSWLCHKDSRWGFCCLSFLRKLVGHNCSWSVFSHVVHFEEEKQFPAEAAHSWPRRHKASRWGFSCCSFLQTHLHSSHCNMTSLSWSSAFGLPSHSFTDVSIPLNFGVFLYWSSALNLSVFLWIVLCFSELRCVSQCISLHFLSLPGQTLLYQFHQKDTLLDLLSNPRRRKTLIKILDRQYHRMPVNAKEWGPMDRGGLVCEPDPPSRPAEE